MDWFSNLSNTEGIALAGVVIMAFGLLVQILQKNKSKSDISIGISVEQYEAQLKIKLDAQKDELTKASEEDKKVLRIQIKETESKLQNLEESYQDKLNEIAKLKIDLADFKDQVSENLLKNALEKLNQGETSAAQEIFDDIISNGEKVSKIAGKAAYRNGAIAQNDIRFLDALNYFKKACL